MKGFLFLAIIPLLVLFHLDSAPVGNTASPQLIQDGFLIPADFWADFRCGYEGDFVSDARLKQTIESSGRVDNYSQNNNSGTFTLNILDRIDIYAVFGSSRTSAEWRFSDSSDGIHNAELETFNEFIWAVGGRAILFEWNKCDLGFGGRYSKSQNQPSWLTIDGVNNTVANSHVVWREWQLNLDISYHIDLFTPYLGIKYSDLKSHLTGFSTSISNSGQPKNTFKNRVPVGLYLGCGLSNGKYFMLNLEARLVDEEAVTVSGDLRF